MLEHEAESVVKEASPGGVYVQTPSAGHELRVGAGPVVDRPVVDDRGAEPVAVACGGAAAQVDDDGLVGAWPSVGAAHVQVAKGEPPVLRRRGHGGGLEVGQVVQHRAPNEGMTSLCTIRLERDGFVYIYVRQARERAAGRAFGWCNE